MPRFLNTYTGEFVWIAEVGTTPYAILSHTWEEEGGEQTYNDIVKLQTECPIANPKPWNKSPPPPVNEAFFSHPKLSEKIKQACVVARNTGFRLVWIDSCCIDKRSSAELSEAINSMYALYRDADVCYVYLADVPRGTDPRAKYSVFRKSRWHKRGWTLQELVAPACVVFLTCDWTFLGTKTGLASTLEKITGVDAAILLGLKPVDSASVAKRMSWAALRHTTRVEDRAYSLLGIFGVHMSPIYGEGTNAFLRLQEEIIRHIPDQSIFAWGTGRTVLALHTLAGSRGPWRVSGSGLLSHSPSVFEDVGDVTPITPSEFAMHMGRLRDLRPLPLHCVFTPQGARIALMTVPLPPNTAEMLVEDFVPDCDDCRQAMARSPFRRLALLRCTDRDGHLIALPLRCPEADVGAAENVAIGIRETCGVALHASPRVVRLSAAVLNDLDAAPSCVEVSILRHSQEPVQSKARREGFSKTLENTLSILQKVGNGSEIRLAPNCEEELGAVGFTLTPLESKSRRPEDPRPTESILTTTININSLTQEPPDIDEPMHPPMLIEFDLQPPGPDDCALGRFSIEFDRLRRPSAIESAHPTSAAPDGLSSRTLWHAESCPTRPTAGNPHRQSHSFDIAIWSTSHTIAEAEFVIPDVTRTDANGTPMSYVRLLRLKLENPLDSAYMHHCHYFLFSIEFSEPFIGNTAATESEPAFASSSSASLENLADNSDSELYITYTAPEVSPPSDLSRLPARHDTTQDSRRPALSPTATIKEPTARQGREAPGPRDVEISIIHDGPDATSTINSSSVPSSPHDTVQDVPESAMSSTVTSAQTAVRATLGGRAAGSTARRLRIRRTSL